MAPSHIVCLLLSFIFSATFAFVPSDEFLNKVAIQKMWSACIGPSSAKAWQTRVNTAIRECQASRIDIDALTGDSNTPLGNSFVNRDNDGRSINVNNFQRETRRFRSDKNNNNNDKRKNNNNNGGSSSYDSPSSGRPSGNDQFGSMFGNSDDRNKRPNKNKNNNNNRFNNNNNFGDDDSYDYDDSAYDTSRRSKSRVVNMKNGRSRNDGNFVQDSLEDSNVKPVYFTLIDDLPFVFNTNAGNDFDFNGRKKRQLGSSVPAEGNVVPSFSVQELIDGENRLRAQMSNFSCVLRSLNMVDQNGRLRVADIARNTNSISGIDQAFKNDLLEIVRDCSKFTECLPGVTDEDSLVPFSLQQSYAFFTCIQKKRQIACIKKDIRSYILDTIPDDRRQSFDLERTVKRILYIKMADSGADPVSVLS